MSWLSLRSAIGLRRPCGDSARGPSGRHGTDVAWGCDARPLGPARRPPVSRRLARPLRRRVRHAPRGDADVYPRGLRRSRRRGRRPRQSHRAPQELAVDDRTTSPQRARCLRELGRLRHRRPRVPAHDRGRPVRADRRQPGCRRHLLCRHHRGRRRQPGRRHDRRCSDRARDRPGCVRPTALATAEAPRRATDRPRPLDQPDPVSRVAERPAGWRSVASRHVPRLGRLLRRRGDREHGRRRCSGTCRRDRRVALSTGGPPRPDHGPCDGRRRARRSSLGNRPRACFAYNLLELGRDPRE